MAEEQGNEEAVNKGDGGEQSSGGESQAVAGKQEHTMGMLCHLAALVGFIGIPLGNIIGPLIVWFLKKDEMPFVMEEGKEALNFQISMTIYGIVAGLLIFVVIGLLLLPILVIADIVFIIIAAVKASKGESYRYPFTLRLIK